MSLRIHICTCVCMVLIFVLVCVLSWSLYFYMYCIDICTRVCTVLICVRVYALIHTQVHMSIWHNQNTGVINITLHPYATVYLRYAELILIRFWYLINNIVTYTPHKYLKYAAHIFCGIDTESTTSLLTCHTCISNMPDTFLSGLDTESTALSLTRHKLVSISRTHVHHALIQNQQHHDACTTQVSQMCHTNTSPGHKNTSATLVNIPKGQSFLRFSVRCLDRVAIR